MKVRERVFVLYAVAAMGCTGTIATSAGDDDDDGKDPGGVKNPGDDNIVPPDAPPDVPDPGDKMAIEMCTPSIPPAPLRRLSYSEYQTTLKDLFSTLAVVDQALLRDPAEHGFENRAKLLNPSPLLVEQYGTAAEDLGIKVLAKMDSVVPCNTQDKACGEQFIASFGEKVFRRPLTDEEKTDYGAFFEKERVASNFNGAVQLTTEVLLQSPQFLYRLEFGDSATAQSDRIQLTGYEIATRLSYLLTGSGPDKDLFDAAKAGALNDAATREEHVRRLLKDAKAGAMMAEFHRQWLDLDREEAKDIKTYPKYDAALKAAIREESNQFVKKVLWEGDGKVGTFLTSNQGVVNGPLAALYGVQGVTGTTWQDATLNPDQRAGFLTRSNFLATRAHQLQGSPPLRSVYILEKFFCMAAPPPDADADTSEPAAKAGAEPKTNRELFEQRIEPATCNACHAQIDTIGYGLENYDAIGGYRTTDNGQPVDATGAFKNTDVDGAFTGGIEMSKKMAASTQVQHCVTENWVQYAVGRGLQDEDKCRLGKLSLNFENADGDIRELLVSLVKSPEYIMRPPVN